jgi:hypothetical protein
MNHIKTFEKFSINEENKLKEFFFGKTEDNDAAKEIIKRLEKVDTSNNPYETERVPRPNEERWKDDFCRYIISFDDVYVTTTYYTSYGPSGHASTNYTLEITPKDDTEYEKLDVSSGLRKKIFKLVDKIYKDQNKKPSVKHGLNSASDLL